MGMQLMRASSFHHRLLHPKSTSTPPAKALFGLEHVNSRSIVNIKRRNQNFGIVASPLWDSWRPEKGSAAPSLSDIIWPSAGAFAAMALLGRMDQILAPKGVSMTIAPLGAVSAVLFATPSAPGARKYNMFMAQIGCAAIGVLALYTSLPNSTTLVKKLVSQKYNMFMAQIGCAAIGVLAFSTFGPGWLARSFALAASVAFMICTRSTHPPAASLPILFIDGAKFHNLSFWYALFPGAAGCLLLCLIQEIVLYLKDNFKF